MKLFNKIMVIKIPFLFILNFLSIAALGQSLITLDTTTLDGATKVILPTYNNLLQLKLLDSAEFRATADRYGYTQYGNAGDLYVAQGLKKYYLRKNRFSTGVFFDVNCKYFKELEDDVKKRFPEIVHSSAQALEQYAINITDNGRTHAYLIYIVKPSDDDDDAPGGCAVISDN
jgi:hypothetical protein